MKPTLALMIAGALALLPASAAADNKADAKVHLDAAATAYKEQRYADVLVELNKAYALEPRPELHYSIGQVYVKLDRCADAIGSYEQFLASKPPRVRAEAAEEAIATCKAKLAAAPPVEPTGDAIDTEAPPNVPSETPPPMIAPVVSDERPAWYKDKLAIGLTAGGAGLTLIGVVLYVNARSSASDAGSADNYGESVDQYDSARTKRTVSLVFVAAGLTATGVGVWRFMKQRDAHESRQLAIVPTANGGLVTYGGGF
ncbi:MAG: hypothetical protein H0T89_35820 [Deltaproteobacteria bacterium]|nr:hypothetical protein [Deltaproteobacteria bacterium]MDQ3298323.1 hypothetical protein [Myxococcota bacterium]